MKMIGSTIRVTGLILALCLPAWGQEEALRRQQEEMRRAMEPSFSSYRLLPGILKMKDICQIRPEGHGWVLLSDIPAEARPGRVRVQVEDLPGICLLTTGGLRRQGMPESFTFIHYNFSDPRAVRITTQVAWERGQLSISRTAQTPSGYYSVTLQHGAMAPVVEARAMPVSWPQPAARSVIQFGMHLNGAADPHRRGVNGSAPDMLSLRRRFGKEIDQHLRPVLCDLGLETVLAVDTLGAWQVFAEDLKPEPALMAQVQQILPALDADSFQARHEGLVRLRQMGPGMLLAVAQLDRQKLSAQQNALLDAALAVFGPVQNAANRLLKEDVDFLLDCLYGDDAAVRQVALDYLRQKTGRTIDFDLEADIARRTVAVNALRRQLRTAEASAPPWSAEAMEQ